MPTVSGYGLDRRRAMPRRLRSSLSSAVQLAPGPLDRRVALVDLMAQITLDQGDL
jgi:hypothetical protein